MAKSDAKYFAGAVCLVAGVPAATLRQWRFRLGLFPAMRDDNRWHLFSLSQICAARLMVVLTKFGLRAGAAVGVANASVELFDQIEDQIASGKFDEPTAVALNSVGDIHLVGDRVEVADLLTEGTSLVVDLCDVFRHVVEQLRDGEHPNVEPANKAVADDMRAFAKGFLGSKMRIVA